VAELPSLRPSHECIAITYFHKNKPNSLHMSQPSQFTGNAWNEGGDDFYHLKTKGGVYEQRSTIMVQIMWGSMAQAIGCHYHLSILDEKGYPTRKFRLVIQEQMWTRLHQSNKEQKQEDNRAAHFGINEATQTKEGIIGGNPSNLPSAMGWSIFYH
jgi:hypothetical protein